MLYVRRQSKTRHPVPPFGLIPNWQKAQPSFQSSAGVLQGNQAHGAASGPDSDSDMDLHPTRTCSSTSGQVSSRAVTSEPDGPAFHFGSFMPDNEGSERLELEYGEREKRSSSKYKV